MMSREPMDSNLICMQWADDIISSVLICQFFHFHHQALLTTYGFGRHDTLLDFIDETKERITPQHGYNSLDDIQADRATVGRGLIRKFIDTIDGCPQSEHFRQARERERCVEMGGREKTS